MNATEARNDLYALVKRAEEDGRMTLIHKRQDRALLAPLDRYPAARKTKLPSHTLSAAQGKSGQLITKAAGGQPQVLRRGTTAVAVLLPADPASGALSSDTTASGAAPAGGAVNSQGNQDRGSAPRMLATPGDA